LTDKRKLLWANIFLSVILLIVSCTAARRPDQRRGTREEQRTQQEAEKPAMPKALQAAEGREPNLKVYIVEEDTVREMPFEEYVAGVVGGEIKNDWPEEAIKAQAIIARTFVMQFIDEKGQSKYQNAHVSTDIEEAQAWNMEAVNDRIRKAVNDTRGQVIVYEGKYANTWFHSNAGGMTATAKEGLNYKEANPPYIQNIPSPDDSPEIPADEKNWTAKFPKAKVIMALQKLGQPLQNFSSVSIGKKGASGRALTIRFDDTEVSAPELRIALGSMEMKSTLLDEVSLEGNQVVFKGRGYGHGVGMSQWGAYQMAKEGKSAEEIIKYYFPDVEIVKMWN